MEEKLETKITFKDKLIKFYQFNKVKIFFSFIVLVAIMISTIFVQQKKEHNNNLIAEKYIKADLNLSQDNKVEAKKLLIEIVLSENKFYSALALNKILEKNLIDDDEKILEYFNIVENLDFKEEELDLIIFKKALFLLKISKNSEGNKILKDLIKKNSVIKKLAEDSVLN
tara:strand:- start:1296 stop:1805 length:510 start_codon:yes stop_codon:yes gene_type:complete